LWSEGENRFFWVELYAKEISGHIYFFLVHGFESQKSLMKAELGSTNL
jgi:hypothetical protein